MRGKKKRLLEKPKICLFLFQGSEEVVVGYAENLFEGDKLVHADVMDSTFDLRVDAAADIIALQLKFGRDLLLCHVCGFAKLAYPCAESAVIPKTLHSRSSFSICNVYLAILLDDIRELC